MCVMKKTIHIKKTPAEADGSIPFNLCYCVRSNHHLNMYRVHNVFTGICICLLFTAPETEAQKVIKYIVSGRWHRNHDGPDGLQKSGNVPGSITSWICPIHVGMTHFQACHIILISLPLIPPKILP